MEKIVTKFRIIYNYTSMEKFKALFKVAFRQQALFIPDIQRPVSPAQANDETLLFVAHLVKLGYQVSEELLFALRGTSVDVREAILAYIREVKGLDKGWTPLVKDWHNETFEKKSDYLATYFANLFRIGNEPTLPCGHYIPKGTFALHRYNGCPFCHTPFEHEALELQEQGSNMVVLDIWTLEDIQAHYRHLLQSKTALDATQVDSLKTLMALLPLPAVKPGMKETLMLVIDALLQNDQPERGVEFLTSPNEVLRYLWYKHTGFLQVIAPKTIATRFAVNHTSISGAAHAYSKSKLNLKYSRQTGRMVARWLNNMEMPVNAMCENMHPKRGMWVRFIRALRLSEISKREGFEKLHELLDVFYNERYEVHAGKVEQYRLKKDAEQTLKLLQKRPGLFARSLFANMLWFGPAPVLTAFEEIMDQVPARLVFTLNMYADLYFDKSASRTVKPLGGVAKVITANKLLKLFSFEELTQMKEGVQELSLKLIKGRFAGADNKSKTIYIAPILFKMPLAIGDRSESIQDLPSALQGTRFPVEGDTVRLFMQWGTGLPAQHLDMDLSCRIIYDQKEDICSYSSKYPRGCRHSGDVIHIPDMTGTAEYIEIDLNVLRNRNARYVIFTCNAFSNGSISPNLVVGWMNSQHEMKITEKGVAYDPSCVQHQVRIESGLTKGLVFGVLEVETNEIIWMELPFQGQIIANLNANAVKAMIRKLDSKLSIGNLLRIKAQAQQLTEVAAETLADEAYTATWARDAAAVTQLFID